MAILGPIVEMSADFTADFLCPLSIATGQRSSTQMSVVLRLTQIRPKRLGRMNTREVTLWGPTHLRLEGASHDRLMADLFGSFGMMTTSTRG